MPEQALRVIIETTKGNILIELNPTDAPISTENFMQYVADGFYDGSDELGATIFHRVIPNFMIQGGGMTEEGTDKANHSPIKNEATNGLKNDRGTLAMARTNDPDSATSQFFINVKDNDFLDAREDNPGYAVFGRVIEGMNIADAIVSVKTRPSDVPVKPIVITSAKVVADTE